MFDVVNEVLPKMRSWVAGFDFSTVDEDHAIELYDKLLELERLASAAKNLAAVQVAQTRAWWWSTYKSPDHMMAAKEAKPVKETSQMLRSVEAMKELPRVEAAYRQGNLSDIQAQDVVSTALVAKDHEEYLLQVAEAEALIEFQRECARVRAAALDEEQRQKNAHSRRFLHNWIDGDGAFRLSGRFTTESGAEIMSALEPFRQEVADRASRRGRRGRISHGAAMADALVGLAKAARSGDGDPIRPLPRAAIHVNVDLSALDRGYVASGEVCEVRGVGPVTVDTVRRWMGQSDAQLNAIIYEEGSIKDVHRMGRVHIPASLEAALIARDAHCVVPGCGEIYDLQTDHIIPVDRKGPTTLYNLCRICSWHHYLKTHHGYLVKRRLGHWLFESPGGVPPTLDELQQELTPARC